MLYDQGADEARGIVRPNFADVDQSKLELDVGQLQTVMNTLIHSPDASERMKQLEFLSVYLSHHLLPPEIFVQLQTVIVGGIGVIPFSEPLLDIIRECAEFFDPELNLSRMGGFLMEHIEDGKAYLAMCELTKHHYHIAKAMEKELGNASMGKEKVDHFEWLHMLECVAEHEQLVPELARFVPRVLDTPTEGRSSVLSVLAKLAKNDQVLQDIMEDPRIVDIYNELSGNTSARVIRRAMYLAKIIAKSNPVGCTKVIGVIALNMIRQTLVGGEVKQMRMALSLTRALCQCEEGVKMMTESGVIDAVFKMPSSIGFDIWSLGFQTICDVICIGSDHAALHFPLEDVVERLTVHLGSCEYDVVNQALKTAWTLYMAHVRANRQDLNDTMAENSEFIDALENLISSGDVSLTTVAQEFIDKLTE